MFRIVGRKSELAIDLVHAAPCLVNEFYRINVSIINSEHETIKNIK